MDIVFDIYWDRSGSDGEKILVIEIDGVCRYVDTLNKEEQKHMAYQLTHFASLLLDDEMYME